MTKLNHSANVQKAIKALDVVTGKTGVVAFADAIRAITLGETWKEEIEDLLTTVYDMCETEWAKLGDKRPKSEAGNFLSAGQHPKFQACRQMIRKYSRVALDGKNYVAAKQSKDAKTGRVSFDATIEKAGGKRGPKGDGKTETLSPTKAVDAAIGILAERVRDLAKNGKAGDATEIINRVRNALDSALVEGRNLAKGNAPSETLEKARERTAA